MAVTIKWLLKKLSISKWKWTTCPHANMPEGRTGNREFGHKWPGILFYATSNPLITIGGKWWKI